MPVISRTWDQSFVFQVRLLLGLQKSRIETVAYLGSIVPCPSTLEITNMTNQTQI